MKTSGIGLQILFLLLFILQVILRFAIKSSMKYMWEAVHQMQFLTYMVLLQIKFPFNLKGFVKFFEVSFGRVDFIEAYIPELSLLIVDKDKLTSDYSVH